MKDMMDFVNDMASQFDSAIASNNRKTIIKQIKCALTEISVHTDFIKAAYYYYIATAYSAIIPNGDKDAQDLAKKQLKYYRLSIDSFNAISLEEQDTDFSLLKAHTLTNYANLLKRCGRFIAAIQNYGEAISCCPVSGMALGNLGIQYCCYGNAVLNRDNAVYFHKAAYEALQLALQLQDPNMDNEDRKHFSNTFAQYSEQLVEHINECFYEDIAAPTMTKTEHKYRLWGLQNRLFLNELNDTPLQHLWIATDDAHISSIVEDSKHPPVYFSMFNQVKQEYTYARYLIYQSIMMKERKTPYYADKGVHLTYSLDYSCYSIRLEHLKSAFTTLFNLFDRIAFLINEYFQIGIRPSDVSFSAIWDTHKGNPNTTGYVYSKPLKLQDNAALQALHWIYYDMENQSEISNPHLPRMRAIRHALTHRYTKVITDGVLDFHLAAELDNVAFHVTDEELESLTMELITTVREAMMYTLFSIRIEEARRHSDRPESFVIHFPVEKYRDSWKL